MIGFTAKAKVKRFVLAQRKGVKTLMTKEFYAALDAEIERVVVASANAAEGNHLTAAIVDVPKKKIADRLICDVRVKERVHEVNAEMLVSKKFLTDLNSYTGAVLVTSVALISGAYMKQLAAGSATAKIANRTEVSKVTEADEDEASSPPAEPYEFEPCLPREHVKVTYTVSIQQAVIECEQFVFTAKTTERIEKFVKARAQQCMSTLGADGPVSVTLLKVERQKGKPR